MTQDKGLLVILSGPSGAGKSTVVSRLMQRRDDICFSVSATTRAPRPGEQEGVSYYFKSPDEFQRMIRENAFLEHAEYVGNCYGTPSEPVDEALARGYTVILDIEVQGMTQVLTRRPEAVSIFLCPPSLQELENRLRKRGTDSEEKIAGRLNTARKEYSQLSQYAYLVINENADAAADELNAIITAEKCRTHQRIENVLKGDTLL